MTLPAAGTYFVTVFKSAGVESVNLVEFTLTAAVTVGTSTPETTAEAATVEQPQRQTGAATARATPVGGRERRHSTTGQLLTTNGLTSR